MSTIALHSTSNISETVRVYLDVKVWFQRTTNRKWPTGNQMVTWPIMSRDPKGQTRDSIRLEPNISKTSGFRDSVPWDIPIGNGLWGIKRSRDRWRHVTPTVLWGTTVGYPSDSLIGFLSVFQMGREMEGGKRRKDCTSTSSFCQSWTVLNRNDSNNTPFNQNYSRCIDKLITQYLVIFRAASPLVHDPTGGSASGSQTPIISSRSIARHECVLFKNP